MADRKAWLGFVRGFPSRVEGVYRDELKRISSSPETAQWFAQYMPQADPAMRTARIQQAAALNAKKIAGAEFAAARKDHGIKSFRLDDLRADIEAEHAAFAPDEKTAAKAGADAAATYRERVLPDLVRGDMDRLTPYLDFDADPAATKEPREVPPTAKPTRLPAQTPAVAPATPGPQADPVLAMLYRRMHGGAENA